MNRAVVRKKPDKYELRIGDEVIPGASAKYLRNVARRIGNPEWEIFACFQSKPTVHRPHAKFTKEEIHIVRGMIAMGMSTAVIASKLGSSTSWLHKLLRRAKEEEKII